MLCNREGALFAMKQRIFITCYLKLLFEKKKKRKNFSLLSSFKTFLFSGPQKFLPPLVYHWRLGRCLAALQTILGVAITVLSLWLLLWAPHLPITDNPYWSGMPVSISTIIDNHLSFFIPRRRVKEFHSFICSYCSRVVLASAYYVASRRNILV